MSLTDSTPTATTTTGNPTVQVPEPPAPGRLAHGGFVHGILTNKKALFGLAILVIFALLALLAPLLAPGNPTDFGPEASLAPSANHLLGTTSKGQDVLALTLWGSRSSLAVGFIVGIAATFIGCLVGIASAYFGKAIDELLSLLTNIFLLIPDFHSWWFSPHSCRRDPPPSSSSWSSPAGQAAPVCSAPRHLSLRSKDFVAAAVVTGEKAWRIMFREILPNMASIVMSTLLGCVIYGIGAQAGLEFLGLGDTGSVSWGTNLYWANNDGALMTGDWWVLLPSGVAIAVVAFALAMINYAVDEITNPRLRVEKKG